MTQSRFSKKILQMKVKDEHKILVSTVVKLAILCVRVDMERRFSAGVVDSLDIKLKIVGIVTRI